MHLTASIFADAAWQRDALGLLLLALMLAPLAGAGWIALQRRDRPAGHLAAAMAFSLLALALAVWALVAHLTRGGDLARATVWGASLLARTGSPDEPADGLALMLAADGITIWLVLLTAVLTPLAILGSAHAIRQRTAGFYMLMLLLESAMLGVFLARNVLWFYVCFEFTLIPLYFLISLWGGPNRRRAANKFFIYTVAGSMLLLAVLIYMGSLTGGDYAFAAVATALRQLPRGAQVLLFAGLFAGFAIKVPLFPLHTWLPLAHTEAPTAGSVVLAGVLLKLGAYGFLRIGVGWLPQAAVLLAPLMGALAVTGILYGALAAWVQSDVKKLVAYSSISHLGFCLLGMFALRYTAATGSVLVMINHGLSTAALFLVVGMIYERYHTRQFAELGGLGRRMPAISFFLVLFALSSMGLPGLNGFVSEFLVLLGAFASGRPAGRFPPTLGVGSAVAAAVGVILSAVYLLTMVGRLVFGPLNEPTVHREPGESALPADATRREWAILAPLAAMVIFLGVWPAPVTRSIEDGLRDILPHVQLEREAQPELRSRGGHPATTPSSRPAPPLERTDVSEPPGGPAQPESRTRP